MDVRCERCRAQYVFDDEQVTPQGLTVQCTNCGYVFRVKKKELVVTVPVRPEDLAEAPMLATAAAPRPHAAAPEQRWTIRQAGGGTLTFTELTTLQKWIVERKVGRDDEVSQGDDAWVRLGTIGELGSFFQVVEAADRGRRAGPSSGAAAYPPPPFPTGAFPSAPPPGTAFPPPRPQAAAPGPAPSGAAELDAEDLASVGGGRRRSGTLGLVAALLVAAAAGLYAYRPLLFGGVTPEPAAAVAATAAVPAPEAPPLQPVAVPITIEVPPSAPAAEPAARPGEASGPAPAPEPPPVEAAAEPAKPPEPAADAPLPRSPVPAPAAAPRGTKALMAQARTLRDKGQVERALELFGRVVSADPEDVDALTGRGLCYLDLGQYHAAEASFRAALQADPEQPDAIMGLAETFRAQGNKAEALRQFQRYLDTHPDGEEAVVARNAIGQLKE